jgi:glycerol kinase
MTEYVAAIDQGTTSTRCLLIDQDGHPVAAHQLEHAQLLPRPGWVEHDPEEIWTNTREVVAGAMASAGAETRDVVAVGVTNQRETTVIWERATGVPIHPAIVWQDTRTQQICARLAAVGGVDRFRATTGLPLATYFAGPKAAWILDEVEGARSAATRGDLLFGTIDSYLLWRMTGGPDGGVHVTDVTNAARTMLMDLRTLAWDPDICREVGVPLAMLPDIRSSSEVYGRMSEESAFLAGTPITGVLGDQHAATFGQACFAPGDAKNTYGTGNFLLLNTGTEPVSSKHGLLTTVAYRLGDQPTVYALEGSIAVTGSLVQWLRDNLGLVTSAGDIEALANTVADNGGVYIVPAFSGLFAPHWRPDARGVVVGLTRYANRGHLARAALEATAFQTREVVDAMQADSDVALRELRVDGGMVVNDTLMQFQANLLGVPVVRPVVTETTALGAAYAAGLAVGFWAGLDDLQQHWAEDRRWLPSRDGDWREREMRRWAKAVERTLGWVEDNG